MLTSKFIRGRSTALAAAAFGAMLLMPSGGAFGQAEDRPQISVTGRGETQAVPDMAVIRLGVTSEAEEAAEAMSETSARVAEVLERLRAAGIEDRDLQTSELSLSPRWHHPEPVQNAEPRITGFVASNVVTVRVRELAALGNVLDEVVAGGANTLNGLSFELAEREPAMDEARRRAVADAYRKAELYAEAADVTLGPVLSISEPESYNVPRPMYRMEAMADSGVPVAEGELTFSASVTVVYGLAESPEE